MISQGRSEHLFHLLSDPEFFLSEKQQFQEISRLFFSGSLLSKMTIAEAISAEKEGTSLPHYIDNFIRFLRSVLVEKVNGKNLEIANQISFPQIAHLFESISRAKSGLKANANKRLVMEDLLFSVPSAR